MEMMVKKHFTCLITWYSNTISAPPNSQYCLIWVQEALMGLLKWHSVEWTYCSTRSVLNIVKILHSPDCLHSQHWEDASANQGSSQRHKTATNIVESFISCIDWGLPTPGGNIWNFIGTLFVYCMFEFTEQEREKCPQATVVLSKDFYMDGVLSGCDNVTEAFKLQDDVTALLASAGFPLRKWCSNHPSILEVLTAAQEIVLPWQLNAED